MFSMFGRTGAPTKKGPNKRTDKFLQHNNMPEIIEIIIRKRFCVARWRHKVSSQTPVTPHLLSLCAYNYVMRILNKMSMMTTLSLCVSSEFSRAVFLYQGGAPHFFLNRAMLRPNPALINSSTSDSRGRRPLLRLVCLCMCLTHSTATATTSDCDTLAPINIQTSPCR